MKEEISRFYDEHMKFLMYRDWSGFELFFIEILKCTSIPALLRSATASRPSWSPSTARSRSARSCSRPAPTRALDDAPTHPRIDLP